MPQIFFIRIIFQSALSDQMLFKFKNAKIAQKIHSGKEQVSASFAANQLVPPSKFLVISKNRL
jgi:hypothetical protein